MWCINKTYICGFDHDATIQKRPSVEKCSTECNTHSLTKSKTFIVSILNQTKHSTNAFFILEQTLNRFFFGSIL